MFDQYRYWKQSPERRMTGWRSPLKPSYCTEDLYKQSEYIFKIIFLIYFDFFLKNSSILRYWCDYFLCIFQNNLIRLMTLSLDAPRDPVFLPSPFLQCRSQTHPRVGPRPSSKQRVGKHSFLLCPQRGRNSASTHSGTHTHTRTHAHVHVQTLYETRTWLAAHW